MPKARSTNRKSGRKLDVVTILKMEYALSLLELAERMQMHHRSVRRYLMELLQEKKIFRRYRAKPDGGGRPYYQYSYRRKQ
jgi:predicted ArsR family transcriptional regulator